MPKHVVRLLLLLLAFLAFAYAGINYLTDPSFYRFGFYRADAVPEIAAGTPKFRGTQYCSTCHAERYAEWSAGVHVMAKCEVCHGPAEDHPASGKLPIPDDTIKLCTLCHEAMPSRPDSQPQIVVAEHPFPHETPIACTACHNPHSPRIEIPGAVVQPLQPIQEARSSISEPLAGSQPGEPAGIPLPAGKCVACHGAQGEGVGSFPALAGMDVDRFVVQMNQFKTGEIPSPMMATIARALSDDEIRELANHYAGLAAEPQ